MRKLNFKDIDNLLKVLKYVVDNSIGLGLNLQFLTRFYLKNLLHIDPDSSKWNKEYRKAYMRLYRFFKRLHKENLVELKKVDGLLWVKASDRAVDLILYARETQTRKTRRRLNEFKYTAKKYVCFKHRLEPKDWEYLFDLFNAYLEDTRKRVLVFLSPDNEIIVKRYSHRFLKKQLKKIGEKLDRIFVNASKKYRIGVFLTLTMNPKSYRTINEACRRISVSWNRFMSFLRRRIGFRPPYVSVLEFQDSGNPHLHVVLFGISRIMDHYELTEYLKKIGFGEIHFEYQVVNRKGKWVWKNPKKKPSKLRNDGVGDYLKKYIRKVFDYEPDSSGYGHSDSRSIRDYLGKMKVSLYFATDKRFFTYSRSLYRPVYLPKEYGWIYVGCYNVYELPDWVYHRLSYSYYGEGLDPPLIEMLIGDSVGL